MINRYGLDTDYFTKKMHRIIRGIENYKPHELARELARISKTADEKVLREDEFNPPMTIGGKSDKGNHCNTINKP